MFFLFVVFFTQSAAPVPHMPAPTDISDAHTCPFFSNTKTIAHVINRKNDSFSAQMYIRHKNQNQKMSSLVSACIDKELEVVVLQQRVAELTAQNAELTTQNAELTVNNDKRAKKQRDKRLDNNKSYKDKNKIVCECGVTTSKTPSTFKTHTKTKKHANYLLCQIIDDNLAVEGDVFEDAIEDVKKDELCIMNKNLSYSMAPSKLTSVTKKQNTPMRRKTRKALRHLKSARIAGVSQNIWSSKFPVVEHETASDHLIYFDYDEKQFRQWVPLEPFTDMSEYDCVSASCVAARLRPSADLRKISRACNRRKTGLFLSDIPTFIGIPNAKLKACNPAKIRRKLINLPDGKATLLTVGYKDNTFHTCLVYRATNSKLFIFEPQRCWYKLRRFPIYAMQDWVNIVEFLLLYENPNDTESDDDEPDDGKMENADDEPDDDESDDDEPYDDESVDGEMDETKPDDYGLDDGKLPKSNSGSSMTGCTVS